MTAESLNSWFLRNKRDFPWRNHPTPYRVWVSEVMLQQTRAQVVVPYFERWMKLFPTIQTLAEAPMEQVIKAWEGLGYYRRARNLHAAAQEVMQKHGGTIPRTKEELLALKGLGNYTASAILSFGFKQRAAAVDGNVLRVISRYAWIAEDIGRSSAKKKIESYAMGFLSHEEPWITAEALIELGATICTPTPRCSECPLRTDCRAYLQGCAASLPIKTEPPKTEKIERGVAIVECNGQILLRKNLPGTIMADLWEFPYFEKKKSPLAIGKELKQLLGPVALIRSMQPVMHTFTRYKASLFPFYFQASEALEVKEYSWVPLKNLHQLPFSSGHRKILRQL